MNTQEQAAFDLMREALEPAFDEIQHVLGTTLPYPFQRKALETALEHVRNALAAAKEVQQAQGAAHHGK